MCAIGTCEIIELSRSCITPTPLLDTRAAIYASRLVEHKVLGTTCCMSNFHRKLVTACKFDLCIFRFLFIDDSAVFVNVR